MSYDIAPGRPGDQGPRLNDAAERPIDYRRALKDERTLDKERPARNEWPVNEERRVDNERAVHDVGSFRRGNAISQELLRRYLLTRALGSSVRSAFQWFGLGLLALAVLSWLGGLQVLAVLIGIAAIGVLLIRALLSGLQRRLSGAAQLGADEHRVEALVGQTRRGLRHELRRVGLPSAPWGPLLILFRLTRRTRRGATLAKLTAIDLSAVVPQSRVDELDMLVARGR